MTADHLALYRRAVANLTIQLTIRSGGEYDVYAATGPTMPNDAVIQVQLDTEQVEFIRVRNPLGYADRQYAAGLVDRWIQDQQLELGGPYVISPL